MKYSIERFEDDEEGWGNVAGLYYIWCKDECFGDGYEINILPFIAGKFQEFAKLFHKHDGVVVKDKRFSPEFCFKTRKDAKEFLVEFKEFINKIDFDMFPEKMNKYDGTLKSIGATGFFKSIYK